MGEAHISVYICKCDKNDMRVETLSTTVTAGSLSLDRCGGVNVAAGGLYHSSPSFSFAGTSITRGLSMMRAVRLPFSTMPTIHAW